MQENGDAILCVKCRYQAEHIALCNKCDLGVSCSWICSMQCGWRHIKLLCYPDNSLYRFCHSIPLIQRHGFRYSYGMVNGICLLLEITRAQMPSPAEAVPWKLTEAEKNELQYQIAGFKPVLFVCKTTALPLHHYSTSSWLWILRSFVVSHGTPSIYAFATHLPLKRWQHATWLWCHATWLWCHATWLWCHTTRFVISTCISTYLVHTRCRVEGEGNVLRAC